MNAAETVKAIIQGQASLADLLALWPGYTTNAAAFQARLSRARQANADVAHSKHYLQPVHRDDIRADRTYLVVQSGASFDASSFRPGREAARAMASRSVTVYLIARR